MYSLPYFKENNPDVVLQFIREHPFAFICGCDAQNMPVATQIPVFIDEKNDGLYLTGHIMRQTDHHKAFEKNPNVLAVFTGAHTYVSASLYSDPQTASTWNYMSVHARGILRFLGEEELLSILKRTTNHFENNPNSPSLYEKLPADYVSKLSKAIVGFEIRVTDIDNVFKLSQNRDEKSYHNIINTLEGRDDDSNKIAEEMTKRTSQLFKTGSQ